MTVITLARKHAFQTSFGADRRFMGRNLTAPRALQRSRAHIELLLYLGTSAAIAAMLLIAALGIHSTILIFRLSKIETKSAALAEELETIKLQSFQFTDPDALAGQARMLQLVEAETVRYVTQGTAEELARK